MEKALALVAQATGFGPGFRLFARVVLPVVLLVELATLVRLTEDSTEDFGLALGMNRLRHAHLELAPELEPYFVTGRHDDANIWRSYGLGGRLSLGRIMAGAPNLVTAINVVVFGVLAALIADTLGASDAAVVAVGLVAALVAVSFFAASGRRIWRMREVQPGSR